jgi:hypothetical protein
MIFVLAFSVEQECNTISLVVTFIVAIYVCANSFNLQRRLKFIYLKELFAWAVNLGIANASEKHERE